MVAKYGDKSDYFDLEDLGNTTKKWDLYGSDAMMIQMLVNILVIFLVVSEENEKEVKSVRPSR